VSGEGEPALLFAVVADRALAAVEGHHVPYLSRHFGVVVFDARGNGRSDRPATAEAYADREIVADAMAVLDAAGVERPVLVGTSLGGDVRDRGGGWYPERVLGVVAIGTAMPFLAEPPPGGTPFYDAFGLDSSADYCTRHGLHSYAEFLEYFHRGGGHRAALDEGGRRRCRVEA
jgi:pimeloyl-ACP methyl ester carboxylesterase